METFTELPERIRRHLEAITESSGLPPGAESLKKITENWLAKKRLFVEQREALDMTEESRFAVEDPRALLLLTYSGSLICLGPLTEEGRSFEYASIKLRADVPDILVTEGCNLAEDAVVDAPLRFSRCPVESSSEILFIASFDPSLPLSDQQQRLLEAAIFLTNGFIKENQSLTVQGGMDHFTMKSIVQYLAKRNSVTQTLARRLLDDYLTMLESGALLGERVPLGRLGRLYLGTRGAQKARVGHNPATGEELLIPAKPETAVPRFSFSKHLKERASRIPPERITGSQSDEADE